MALFLVQHGISASKDMDPEKGLSDLGTEETNRIAMVAKGYEIPVQKIVHSGKKRAEQTAAIYHQALALETPMEMISGINPMDDIQIFASRIQSQENWMVIGHMPFLERLVSFLTTGWKGGVDEAMDWFIKWTLNPNIS